MIVVCSMETSATIRWSPNTNPLPCFAKRRWDWCKGHANRDRGPQRQFKFSNPLACPLNSLTPHSATQWGEGCSGQGCDSSQTVKPKMPGLATFTVHSNWVGLDKKLWNNPERVSINSGTWPMSNEALIAYYLISKQHLNHAKTRVKFDLTIKIVNTREGGGCLDFRLME